MKPAPKGKAARPPAKAMSIDLKRCVGCSYCKLNCPQDAVIVEYGSARVDPEKCTRCGVCRWVCPVGAIR